MRELRFIGPGWADWHDVADPVLAGPAAAMVRPIAVGTCDLDALIIRGEVSLPGGFPLGHEFVAEVVSVGESVLTVNAGDLVSVPFQINCGECVRCRRGMSGRCSAVPPGSSYGLGTLGGAHWGGALSDLVVVPYADAMCIPLPHTADASALAGLSDNLPDGWRTVAPHVGPGGAFAADRRVLILGKGSIGLYAAAVARALGAEVLYVDPDERNCMIAAGFGAAVRHEVPRRKYPSHPVVVHTTATVEGLRAALRATASSGVCTDVGIFFEKNVPLPLFDMYAKGITFITGRTDARSAMPQVLSLVNETGLPLSAIITQTASWDDAPEAWCEQQGRLVLVRPAGAGV